MSDGSAVHVQHPRPAINGGGAGFIGPDGGLVDLDFKAVRAIRFSPNEAAGWHVPERSGLGGTSLSAAKGVVASPRPSLRSGRATLPLQPERGDGWHVPERSGLGGTSLSAAKGVVASPRPPLRSGRATFHARASSTSTWSSISIFTGRMPAYQRALDHSQSRMLATRPRRTGLA